jgi:hypothetical protein
VGQTRDGLVPFKPQAQSGFRCDRRSCMPVISPHPCEPIRLGRACVRGGPSIGTPRGRVFASWTLISNPARAQLA